MRAIDGDALIKKLDDAADELNSKKSPYLRYAAAALESVSDDVKNAPIFDAVPVVRCRECIRFEACIKCGFLEKDEGDWYCADGERKDDEIG